MPTHSRLSALPVALFMLAAGCSSPPSGTGTAGVCADDTCADVGPLDDAQDLDADGSGAVDASADTGADAGLDDVTEDASEADATEDATIDDADDATADADDATADATHDTDADDCSGAALNACGGCARLVSSVGSPCGTCSDGAWVCDGPDALRCEGASVTPPDWWRDNDRDGFGDADGLPYASCFAPSADWADNQDDCNDNAGDAYPGAPETCDGTDQDCDGVIDNIPADSTCRDACCDDALTCQDGACVVRCDDGTRCGAESELCCEGSDICYADACAEVDTLCEFTEECALDEICEPSLGICLPRAVVPVCEFVPPVGEFTPSLDCRWTSAGLTLPERADVVGTPVVINLSDDDGNGTTDENDVPEIAFLSYDLGADGCCNVAATLRVVSGLCNEDGTMDTLASISEPQLTNDTGIAAADLDGDGVAELIALTRIGGRPQGTVAFTRLTDDATQWEVLWQNPDYPRWNVHTRGGAVIGVANLDAAGAPEVVIGSVALNGLDGTLLWDGMDTAAEAGQTGGVGNNAFLGPAAAIADIDLDGLMEVAAGNTLYEHDGTPAWTFPYATNDSACEGSLTCDGFTAFGNFDDDDFGEVVSVRVGEVFIWNHDGSLLWQATIPSVSCSRNESGPPTIADFDGDGFPEIGTASADYYVVLDPNTCDTDDWEANGCSDRNILWKQRNADCSSRATGSSVFDFEGDGRAEVVYADETKFRIFDGLTGEILHEDTTHGSHTRIEMPVIADVDNDGNSEIIIPENGSHSGRPGIDVWADDTDNWVRTRRVWNQHGYSITHINEDGTVPLVPEINWLNPRLNNWRQNTQPAGIFDAPDLVLRGLSLLAGPCPLRTVRVYFTVANAGALSVPAGAPVRLTVLSGDDEVTTQTVRTTGRLFPGNSEAFTVDVALPDTPLAPPYTVTTDIDPDATINECDEDNNGAATFGVDCYP